MSCSTPTGQVFTAGGRGSRPTQAGWCTIPAERDSSRRLQWFGSATFWLFWENGYRALAALDDDGDGELRGRELRDLAIWHDVDQNGISERGEVRPLSAWRIVAISWAYADGDGQWTAAHAPRGVTFADGATRPTYDVILRSVGAPVSLTLNRP